MILVFGSVNLDIIHRVDTLPKPGQTVRGSALRIEPGGKGANQAAAAALDGAQVAFAGAVGRDPAADMALAGLGRLGVDLSRVIRTDVPTGIASICVDGAGENQITVGSGANLLARAEQVADADLGPGTTLLLQMEVDPAQNAALIRRARARGARIVLNLAPALPIGREVLAMLDWLSVNQEEAIWLAGRLGTTAEALGAALGVRVVRTLGSQGADATTREGRVAVRGMALQTADTTGAGDCFTGVFAAALDAGASVAQALRRANVAAGLSCARPGSQGSYPGRAEIEAALPGGPRSAGRSSCQASSLASTGSGS
jgi:ribokinase